ncbi:hypothetical protein V5799_010123 [Amblyomma americanum]|uniref:Uncharacterized protein n=1 Tax=Amblyomma americanum TaxID=6943 RepID=A0AAQ4F8K0_AMBAM
MCSDNAVAADAWKDKSDCAMTGPQDERWLIDDLPARNQVLYGLVAYEVAEPLPGNLDLRGLPYETVDRGPITARRLAASLVSRLLQEHSCTGDLRAVCTACSGEDSPERAPVPIRRHPPPGRDNLARASSGTYTPPPTTWTGQQPERAPVPIRLHPPPGRDNTESELRYLYASTHHLDGTTARASSGTYTPPPTTWTGQQPERAPVPIRLHPPPGRDNLANIRFVGVKTPGTDALSPVRCSYLPEEYIEGARGLVELSSDGGRF